MRVSSSHRLAAFTAIAILCASSPLTARQCNDSCATKLVSANPTGAVGNGSSYSPFVSANGRFVVFWSTSTDLVPNDSNGQFDVFLRDLANDSTTLVSIDSNGNQGNGASTPGPITPDGRYILFNSKASNLVPNDTNFHYDVFLRDRVTSSTSRESVGTFGVQGNSDSFAAAISDDGRWVLFSSWAGTLVAGDSNIAYDVFLRDRTTGVTTRESLRSDGAEGNGDSFAVAMSADQRYVLFNSDATNLVPGDTNGSRDVFLRDRSASTTERLSVGPGGVQGNSMSSAVAMSFDARFVLFSTNASNLVAPDANGFMSDVVLLDRASNSLERLSVNGAGEQGNANSFARGMSPDLRFVYFESDATNLVAGDVNDQGDVFARDRTLGRTSLVSVASSGAQGDGQSFGGVPSADATVVGFETNATNFDPSDTNGFRDVFVRSCSCATPTIYCTAKPNSLGCTPMLAQSGTPSASAGSGFAIDASNVLNHKSGLLFYGKTRATFLAFQGGYLCVQPPLVRTQIQSSGGNPPPNDCSGAFAIDFNAWIASGQDPALVAGENVWAQYWCRDPGVQPSVSFTPAVAFVVGL